MGVWKCSLRLEMVLGKIFSLQVKMACEVGSLSLYNVHGA